MWWLIGDVVAHRRCGGSSCGGSSEMWWLIGDGVAHWRCGGSLKPPPEAKKKRKKIIFVMTPFEEEKNVKLKLN